MGTVLPWITGHPVFSFAAAVAAYFFLVAGMGFLQGRAVSFWPPRVEGKPLGRGSLRTAGTDGESDGTMSVVDAIRTRKSVRSYTDRSVEPATLERLFEAARSAPSASNRQEWRFVAVTDPAIVSALSRVSCIGSFIANANTVIAACAETDNHVMRCGQLSYPIDVAIALDHLSLAAVELGLGTCWIGMFDEKGVKAVLGIPEKIRVVALMTLGYPSDPSPVEKKRKPLRDIVMYDGWKNRESPGSRSDGTRFPAGEGDA